MSDTPRLRVLLVGASGTLGRAVAAELGARHDIIAAGSKSGDIRIDITDPASIATALKQAGELDAVVCAAGEVAFVPLAAIEPAAIAESVYGLGLRNKLMGQVNLALAARAQLRDGGSITLTTGILTDNPIAAGSSATMVNAAVEGFVRAAAIELPRGIRINVVSPNVLQESMPAYAPFFRGFEPVAAARAALAYSRSVEGLQTGQVYRVV
ncbi:short chain dehydrogenase [Limobrevibacterium gyesilva]|uniref:Short chain dehydrogenase n=1 Tax=Limobrevibacterium gyesilva TaxID=2991712 RepID=A0AA42CFF4_9PROT|nr:short chain dehydrogenase [Limobrevibacterium gyesilva]MCW3477123.1 short chain dehydrogenase [Limobrevibacterium gyesilva]